MHLKSHRSSDMRMSIAKVFSANNYISRFNIILKIRCNILHTHFLQDIPVRNCTIIKTANQIRIKIRLFKDICHFSFNLWYHLLTSYAQFGIITAFWDRKSLPSELLLRLCTGLP